MTRNEWRPRIGRAHPALALPQAERGIERLKLDIVVSEVSVSVRLGPFSEMFQRLTREIAGDLGFRTGTLRTFGHGVPGCSRELSTGLRDCDRSWESLGLVWGVCTNRKRLQCSSGHVLPCWPCGMTAPIWLQSRSAAASGWDRWKVGRQYAGAQRPTKRLTSRLLSETKRKHDRLPDGEVLCQRGHSS